MKKCYAFCICILLIAMTTLNAANNENNLITECTTLTAPEDGALDIFPDENLFWTPVPDAAGYIVRMGTQSGAGDFLDNIVTEDAFLNIPTMDFNTIYYVTVTPFSSNVVAENCIETTFQVGDILSPDCLSIDSPANGATDVSIFTSFEWTSVDNAFGYVFNLGTTQYGNELIDGLDVGDVTTFSVNELAYSTTYYISVIPYGDLGDAIGCDEEVFTTEGLPTPPCPLITTPNNNATNVPLETVISWDASDGADGYTVSVGTNPNGTDIINEENIIGATSLNPGILEFSTTYYVSIDAYNDFGPSQECVYYSFTTEAEPVNISITCPTNQLFQAPIGVSTMVVNWETPIASTLCADGEFTLTQLTGLPNGSEWPVGETTTVKYEVTDNCNNISTCDFEVTIEENLLEFSISCPNDVDLTTNNPNGRVITLNEPFVTTNCGAGNITFTQIAGPESGTMFPLGDAEVTYEATLICNGQTYTEICSYNVAIELESTDISINCPSNLILEAPIGASSMIVNWEDPIGSTSCGDPTLTMTQIAGLPNGSEWPVGETTTVTYEVTDNCGNTNTCSFDVTIEPTLLAFTISCPNEFSFPTDNPDGRILNLDEPTFTTNCGAETIVVTQTAGPESGTLFPIGLSTITYQASLVCNGQTYTETCTFGVNVQLVSSEISITCPTNQILQAPIGVPSMVVNWEDPITTTTCTDDDITLLQIEGLPNGSDFPAGETVTVTYEVTDECGNGNSCNFNVTVEENLLAFSINCPNDVNLVADTPGGRVITLNEPFYSTNCGEESIAITQTAGPISGTLFPVGNSTVTYEVALICNGQTYVESCSYNINIELEPTDCVDAIDGFTLLGQYENHNYFLSQTAVNWSNASAIASTYGATMLSVKDANENEFVRNLLENNIVLIGLYKTDDGNYKWDSGDTLTFDFIETPPADEAAKFANMNFWSGGWSFDSQFVERLFVMEITCGSPAPKLTVTCPEDQTITSETLSPVAITWDAPTATTTCENTAITINQIAGPEIGSLIQVGENVTITYEITDTCDNVETCSFTISVSGTNPPVTGCPDNVDGLTLLGEFGGHKYFKSNEASTWLAAAEFALENGGYLVSINDVDENEFIRQSISEISFIGLNDFENEGTLVWDSGESFDYTYLESLNQIGDDFATINFWSGSWALENDQVSKPFIVEYECEATEDTILAITCPENLTLEAIEGANSVFLTWEIPTASSNCPDGTITIEQTRGLEYGSMLEVGENVNIGYEISDACGNIELCEFNIEVVPFEPSDCPEEAADYTFLGNFEEHSYFIYNNAMVWEDAQVMAADLGGYLVSVSSPTENEFIRSSISEITFIGLHDRNEEGVFEWDSGEIYFEGNLLDGNSEDGDFGTINFWNGGWGTVDQFVQKPFIVELDCQILPQGNELNESTGPVSIEKVYPNPSKELVTIEIESKIEAATKIQIFDVLGIFQKEIDVELVKGKIVTSIEISDLKNGIHFLQIENGQGALSKKKFVKYK